MKIGIATSLSVAGVIAAGAAAFALNSAVLSGESTQISSGNVATTLADPSTAGVAASAADADVSANSTQVSDSVTTYNVGTAGSVVIDDSAGTVNVTDVVPASGWTAEPARTQPDGSVKVHFTKGATRIEFTAVMSAGKVAVAVTNESMQASPGAGTATQPSIPPALRGDDDDDDDGREHHGEDHHEDDDHEDEDHEEFEDD